MKMKTFQVLAVCLLLAVGGNELLRLLHVNLQVDFWLLMKPPPPIFLFFLVFF